MGELISLPKPNDDPLTLEEWVEKAHKIAQKSENVFF